MSEPRPSDVQRFILAFLRDGCFLDKLLGGDVYQIVDPATDRSEGNVSRATFGVLLRHGWIARSPRPEFDVYSITDAGRRWVLLANR